jgi:glutathione synthase/RimK-type ligase-like ATP-grasp enzyme
MILLVTSKDDVTTDLVVDRLNICGAEYYRFNTEELCKSIKVIFEPKNNKLVLYDTSKGQVIDLAKIKSIYYRRPKLPVPPADLLVSEQRFVMNEIAHTLEGIYKYLDDKFWISNVFSIRQAENKLYQQLVANRLGFTTPESFITNDYKTALNFLQVNGECIVKPIKSGLVDDGEVPKVIFTSLITKDNVSTLERIAECPTYFQAHIKKTADIRVTVVGTSIFSAKIYSQAFEDTRIDWRKGDNLNLKYEAIDLGQEMNEACINLTRFLGLQFGALDFILDDKGRYIFLEINPNGQWGWIQYRLNNDISGTIANMLTNPPLT